MPANTRDAQPQRVPSQRCFTALARRVGAGCVWVGVGLIGWVRHFRAFRRCSRSLTNLTKCGTGGKCGELVSFVRSQSNSIQFNSILITEPSEMKRTFPHFVL